MKNGIKRVLLILFFIVLVAGIGIAIYSFTSGKNVIKELITNIKPAKVDDYHNGIYYNEKPLNVNYTIYNGCSVSAFTTYIVVMNDQYVVYDGSCMRNLKVEEGKTEDLVFTLNNSTKKYEITYKDKVFKKSEKTNNIIEVNNLQTRFHTSSVKIVDFVIDNVEEEGSYFPMTISLTDSSRKYKYTFEYVKENNNFKETVSIMSNQIYETTFVKKEDRPSIEFIGNNMVLLEKDKIMNGENLMYRYNIVLLTDKIKYNLKNEFPIMVNGVRIDMNKNIYAKRASNSTYNIIIGNENTFCNEEKKDSDDISYYEFELKYDFKDNTFNSPELKKIGKYSEGCSYVNKVYFGG